MTAKQLVRILEPVLQEGDLIFLDINNFAFKKVARATNSWTSHVGIAVRSIKNDRWNVMESTTPIAKETSLENYLSQSDSLRFEIKRLKSELTVEQREKVKQIARSYKFRLYNFGFDFDKKWSLFCSKLVYLSFLKAADIRIGEVQTFKTLFELNGDEPLGFWRFWFLGFIPWSRRTVTPASQLNDSKLKTVYSYNINQTKNEPVISNRPYREVDSQL